MGNICRNRRALTFLGVGLALSGALIWLAVQKGPALFSPTSAKPHGVDERVAVARPAVAVQVLTTNPGMSTEAVEKTITSRVERWINQAPGVTRVESKSIEGASLLTVYFREDADPESALIQTNSLALAALPGMPAGTLPPIVLPCDGSQPREITDILKLLPDPGAAAKDLKELQGEWVLVSFKKEGEELPPQAKKARMTVEGERGAYKSDVGEWKLTFKIDPSRTPKTMDMTSGTGEETVRYRGIYKIEEDTLTICRPADHNEERPKAFPAEQKGLVLMVWKRAAARRRA